LQDILLDTLVFNVTWIANALATLFTLVAVTRDKSKWVNLALPVMIGWHIAGLTPFFLFYIIGAIGFVINALSLQTIGSMMNVLTRQKEPSRMDRAYANTAISYKQSKLSKALRKKEQEYTTSIKDDFIEEAIKKARGK
jgi:predicted lipid-binding transport protein (Tim44 family)